MDLSFDVWLVRLDNSSSSHLEWELSASSSDFKRVSSYWSGAAEEVDRVVLAVSSDNCVVRDVLVVPSRLE